MKRASPARVVLERATLALLGCVVCAMAIELVLPHVVAVTDNLDYEAAGKTGLRLKPNQRGRYIRDGIDGTFAINNAGFNNPHPYVVERTPGRRRIAVVGDSFVEALQVHPAEAFFSVMERRFAADGHDAEVYSFGVSGFGTSQVYELLKDEVVRYSPDAIVYLFVVNDVDDSSPCHGRAAWTQQYDLGEDGRLIREPFAVYEPSPLKWFFSGSATLRYLMYQRRLLERVRTAEAETTPGAATGGECEETSWRIVETLLRRIDEMCRDRGIPWVLAWQGDSDPVYYADIRERLEAIATRDGLPYHDLSRDFVAARERGPFRIPGDGHWNATGHAVAGNALAALLEPRVVTAGR